MFCISQLGHDVYVIGVQECLCLPDLREALHNHLGGKSEYVMYAREIGSTNTALGFHGLIGMTVFAKTEDVDSGAFTDVEGANGEILRGVNLGVTRAANKGTVGLPFRYHDASLAFLTCHFASDSKGKNKIQKRHNDARAAMQDVCLVEDNIGFDAQLTVQVRCLFICC